MKNSRARIRFCGDGTDASRGFTLIEVMVVIVIIGILTTVVITSIGDRDTGPRQAAAKAHIVQIKTAVQLFKMENNRLPNSLDELVNRPADAKSWPGSGYLELVPKDLWGNDYLFRVPGSEGRPFEVVCYGADGKEGGEDAKADITSYAR